MESKKREEGQVKTRAGRRRKERKERRRRGGGGAVGRGEGERWRRIKGGEEKGDRGDEKEDQEELEWRRKKRWAGGRHRWKKRIWTIGDGEK